jgi:hypothetical protein
LSLASQAVYEGSLPRNFDLRFYDTTLHFGELLLLRSLVFGHGFSSGRFPPSFELCDRGEDREREAVRQVPRAQLQLCGDAALSRLAAPIAIYSR